MCFLAFEAISVEELSRGLRRKFSEHNTKEKVWLLCGYNDFRGSLHERSTLVTLQRVAPVTRLLALESCPLTGAKELDGTQ